MVEVHRQFVSQQAELHQRFLAVCMGAPSRGPSLAIEPGPEPPPPAAPEFPAPQGQVPEAAVGTLPTGPRLSRGQLEIHASGQISEIFFMLAMPLFFVRLGVKWMLFVGMLSWVVRYGLFSYAHADDIMWMVMFGIVLHGICYDFFFVTGFIYTDKKCTPEIRGQAQGFLVLVTQGLGLGLGAQIMNRIVGSYTPEAATELQGRSADLTVRAWEVSDAPVREGLLDQAQSLAGQAAKLLEWDMIWLIPCIAAGVVMVAFTVLFKDDSKKGKEGKEGTDNSFSNEE